MAIYYISPTGNDSNDGLSTGTAWQDPDVKVTGGSFSPGDQILFECDGTYAIFTPPSNGASGNRIKFGAYGTGAMPKFSSFVTPTWTPIGGGLHTYTNASFGSAVKTVKVGIVLQGKGRFPGVDQFCRISASQEQTIGEGGVAWVESAAGSTPPDWHVDLPATDYTGAEICIRKNHYNYHVALIDDVDSGRIYYGSDLSGPLKGQYVPIVGFGFFIQNHISCLTEIGDWMYDATSKTITMYFGAEDPGEYEVKIALEDTGFSLTSKSELDFENLDLSGFHGHGATHSGCSQITWFDCVASFCGSQGIHLDGTNSYCKVEYSELFNCHGGGAYADYNAHHITYQNNYVHDIALVIGGSDRYGNADTRGCGLVAQEGAGNLIQHNRVIRTGFNSIVINGDAFKAIWNFCQYYDENKTDGGGIYFYFGVGGPVLTIRGEVTDNICVDGVGYPLGTNEPESIVHGIYADDNSELIAILRNLCARNAGSGIYLHNTLDVWVQYNTLFGNKRQFNMDQGSGLLIRDTLFTYNKLYCDSWEQTFLMANSAPMEVDQFGTFDHNTYLYIENHVGRFGIYNGSDDVYNQFHSFAEWKLACGGEENSIFEAYQAYAPAEPTVLATLFNQIFPSDGSQVGTGAGQFINNSSFAETWVAGEAVLTKEVAATGKRDSYMSIGGNIDHAKVYLLTQNVTADSDQYINVLPEHTFTDDTSHNPLHQIPAGTSNQEHRTVLEGMKTFTAEKLLWMVESGFSHMKWDNIKLEEIAPFDFESDLSLIYNSGTDAEDFTYETNRKRLDTGIVALSFSLEPGEFAVLQKTAEPLTPVSGTVIYLYAKLTIV